MEKIKFGVVGTIRGLTFIKLLQVFGEDVCLHAVCENNRTNHIRLDKMVADNGQPIPRNKPYAILIESDQPIVAQVSRLDVSQPEYALMTTIAY